MDMESGEPVSDTPSTNKDFPYSPRTALLLGFGTAFVLRICLAAGQYAVTGQFGFLKFVLIVMSIIIGLCSTVIFCLFALGLFLSIFAVKGWFSKIALTGILLCTVPYIYSILRAVENGTADPSRGGIGLEEKNRRLAQENAIVDSIQDLPKWDDLPQLTPSEAEHCFTMALPLSSPSLSCKVVFINRYSDRLNSYNRIYSELNYRIPEQRLAGNLEEADLVIQVPNPADKDRWEHLEEMILGFICRKDGILYHGTVERKGVLSEREFGGIRTRTIQVGAGRSVSVQPYYVTTKQGSPAMPKILDEMGIPEPPAPKLLRGWVPERYYYHRFILWQSEDEWYTYVYHQTHHR